VYELSADERYGTDSFANSVPLFNHITHGSAYKTCRSMYFGDRDHQVPQSRLLGSETYLEISLRRKQPRILAVPSHCAIVVGLARLSLRPQIPPTPSAKLETGEKWKPTAVMRQKAMGGAILL